MKNNLLLAGLFIALVFASCKPDRTAPGSIPSITGFTPAGGKPGDTVVLSGANFSMQPSDDIVALNSTAASVINATNTTLTVTVPMGATTGKFSVTLNGHTGVSSGSFTVLPLTAQPPAIASFLPASGVVGAQVIITGTGFSSTPANNTVKFANNITATVTAATTTQLTVTVPQHAVTGTISITVSGTGSTTTATPFTVIPPPVISSFTPALGLPGDTVVITGSGFATTAADNTITFANNVTAQVTAATATQLTVVVPATAVSGTLSATANGLSVTSTASFEILKDIPRNDLVAYYPFSGNGNDAGGNGFNLSLAGTYASVNDRFGGAGKAYYFNGGNSYAYDANILDAQVAQPLTVGLWVKYDSLISSSVIGKYDVSTGGYLISINADGSINAYTSSSISYTTAPGVMPANTAGQWIFLAVTYDGATITVYKNAVVAGSGSYTGTVSAVNGILRIGLSGDGGTGLAAFKCAIDDVTIYSSALGSADIQRLYTQTVSKK